ncbi:MAG: plastocyanin [Halioglobus sp.]|jgi:plastocyanin
MGWFLIEPAFFIFYKLTMSFFSTCSIKFVKPLFYPIIFTIFIVRITSLIINLNNYIMKRVIPILIFLAFSFMASAQLVISEISYNPPESGTDSLEYIELYNETNATIDLAGYIIEDNGPDTIVAGSIPAGGYRILAINPTAIMTVLGVEAIAIEGIALSNGGERIAISAPSGNLIDEVTYDDEGDWPSFGDGADGAGATLELCDVTSDNSMGSNWGVSTNDLGVMVNGVSFLGTPNAANSASCEFVPDHIVEVSNNKFTPENLVINEGESVRWMNVQGFHNVNGSLNDYPDNPEGFRNGNAASGSWIFDYTFNVVGVYDYQCDPHVGLGMVGTVTVMGEVEPTIPVYDIGLVNTIDSDGLPDSSGVQCVVEGVVHGANLRPGGLQFALVDDSGDALGLFSGTDLGYTYAEGDLIKVTGFIGHFSGLLQIDASAVELVSSGNSLQGPLVVTELGEATESQLIKINGLSIENVGDWSTADPGGFNTINFTDGTNTFVVFIDGDTELGSWSGPEAGSVFSITGIGGQFDSSVPHNEGYQLIPRYISDFDMDLSIAELEGNFSVYPNPVFDILNIDTDTDIESYVIYNNMGQIVSVGSFQNRIDVRDLAAGMYRITLLADDKAKVLTFVK